MRRNCLVVIAIWVALVAAYALFLRQWLEPVPLAVTAPLMGTVMVYAVMLFDGVRVALVEDEARERIARGIRPQDGDTISIAGEIRPTLDSLHAPFSGRACVAYTYQIGGIPTMESVAKDYAGFAFARCAVHTPYGSFPIATFPAFEGFRILLAKPEDAQRFVAETTFTTKTDVMELAKSAYAIFQTPAPMRIDWAIGTPASIEGKLASETVVESNTRVIASGRYSAHDQSIHEVRLRAGEDDRIRRAGALGRAIAALMVIGAAHVILWAVLTKLS